MGNDTVRFQHSVSIAAALRSHKGRLLSVRLSLMTFGEDEGEGQYLRWKDEMELWDEPTIPWSVSSEIGSR